MTPPDQRGLVTAEDAKALKGFADIKARFFEKEVKSTKEPFNMVVMREDVSKGEHIDGIKSMRSLKEKDPIAVLSFQLVK